MTDATDLATPPKGPSGKRLGFVVAAVALVALLALLAIGMTRDPRELPSALIGKPLPAFSLPGMKRADPPLTQADLLGKTRVINVWASWCVACQSEHPVLLAWQRELVAQGRGHTLYGVNYKDTPDAARIWLLRGRWTRMSIRSSMPKDGWALTWVCMAYPKRLWSTRAATSCFAMPGR
jgi:thiol-disulfide isomerase/thioredoxin